MSGSSEPTRSPVPNAPPAIVRVPDPEPGLITLTTVAPRHAGTSIATLPVRAGNLVVTILCSGGQLTVHVDPVATSTVTCAEDRITPVRNVHGLGSAKDVNISVDAPDTVEWSMRVEM